MGRNLAVLAQMNEGEIVRCLGLQSRAAQGVEAHVGDVHRRAAVRAVQGVTTKEILLGGREPPVAALADEATEQGATKANHQFSSISVQAWRNRSRAA